MSYWLAIARKMVYLVNWVKNNVKKVLGVQDHDPAVDTPFSCSRCKLR